MAGKRGLSTVVTTVLLVLIGVIAVVTVWAVIKPMIDKNINNIGDDADSISINLDIERIQHVGNNYNVTIKNLGSQAITQMKLAVYSEATSNVIETGGLEPLQKKTFNFSALNPTKIEIYPVLIVNGVEKIGNLAASKDIL